MFTEMYASIFEIINAGYLAREQKQNTGRKKALAPDVEQRRVLVGSALGRVCCKIYGFNLIAPLSALLWPILNIF